MTVIGNGLIVDGSGGPPFIGDVVIDGDTIADVVRRDDGGETSDLRRETRDERRGEGRETIDERQGCARHYATLKDPNRPYLSIDATGCIVSPGFIDAHAHSDAYLILEPSAPSKVSQGITTEINGQCGGSAAPRYGEARLSSDWASLLGPRLSWRSFAEYREAVESARPAVNTVQFVGHNTLRSSVVGYAGRAATDDELRSMERLLAESLDAGGWGLTTGLIYQPGKYSTPGEVCALAKVAAEKGGIYATHMRSEGDAILEAIDEVIALARASGIRAEISHLKTSGRRNWGKIDDVLAKIEGAMGEGLLIGSDRYPYCAAGTDLDVVFPDWAGEGGAPAECARLADPATRARIVAEIDALDRDWSTVMIGGTWHEETRAFSGKSISEILGFGSVSDERETRDERRDVTRPYETLKDPNRPYSSPGELICRILELDECRTGAFFFGMSEDNLDKILSRPWIVPGSDASLRAPWGPLGADHPHPRAYATMPEFYRRLRALGVPREEAVARMTSVPAARFGIRRRGILERGAFADVAVWREGDFRGNATYAVPHRFSSGMEAVVVNGVVTYRDGKSTGERAGRFLGRSEP